VHWKLEIWTASAASATYTYIFSCFSNEFSLSVGQPQNIFYIYCNNYVL